MACFMPTSTHKLLHFFFHFYPCIESTNFWATIEFIHFLSFWAAHICKAPKISIFSCLAWNSLRVPSFFILVTVCIMSWISSSVQVSQKDMLFLHDSLSGPSGSECWGWYDAIKVLYADFKLKLASDKQDLSCSKLSNLLCHRCVFFGTRCENQFASSCSGVTEMIVSTPPGFRIRYTSFKDWTMIGKDIPSGSCSRWCKTWNVGVFVQIWT